MHGKVNHNFGYVYVDLHSNTVDWSIRVFVSVMSYKAHKYVKLIPNVTNI